MEILRPAGYNERRCIAREELGVYGTIVSVGTYTGPAIGSPQQVITQAVQRTILEHPALGTVVQDANAARPQVAKKMHLDLNQHLSFLEGKTVEQLLKHTLNDPPQNIASEPQWRVYVVPLHSEASTLRFHLAFSCSHVLADGTSLVVFQESMLRNLSVLQTAEVDVDPHNTPTSKAALPPALDQAGKFPISWSFLLGPLFNEYLPGPVARLLGAKTGHAGKEIWHGPRAKPSLPEPGNLISTSICSVTVPSEVFNQVLLACKKHNSRLTGLVNLCAARALAQTLQKRGQTWQHFKISNPLNMRRPLQQGEGMMTNYVSGVDEVLSIDQPYDSALSEADWAVTSKTTERLAKASATMSDQPIALLGYLSDFPGWVKKKATTPADGSFEISNIGVIDGRGAGGWKIEDISFSQSADGTGDPFNMSIVSVKGGALALVMSWWPGMLGVEDEEVFAEETCSSIERQLRDVASP